MLPETATRVRQNAHRFSIEARPAAIICTAALLRGKQEVTPECGFIAFSGNLIPKRQSLVQKMMGSYRPPRPGHGRMYTDDGIALWFRRLSILDLSDAGAQPMANEDTKAYRCISNGEIYNLYGVAGAEVSTHVPLASTRRVSSSIVTRNTGTELIHVCACYVCIVLGRQKQAYVRRAGTFSASSCAYYYRPGRLGLVFGARSRPFEHPNDKASSTRMRCAPI